jgi:hypothetical protein
VTRLAAETVAVQRRLQAATAAGDRSAIRALMAERGRLSTS